MCYFLLDKGTCDGSGIDTPAAVDLGKRLRRYWTSFAKTGVPTFEDGTSWPRINRTSGVGLPLVHMSLNSSSVQRSAWFNNEIAELLSSIACGKVHLQALGCHSANVGNETVVLYT